MKYGFLGCGNMGSAIARVLSKTTDQIMITDQSGKAKNFAKELGCVYTDIQTIANECDRIFLAVKPQVMESALSPLKPAFAKKKPMLISMAAGLSIEKIEAMTGTALPIIRIMPNTPVSVGCGMIQFCCNQLVTEGNLSSFLEDMRYCGKLDAIDERLIDSASALSGCGPAYMYMFAEALADGAVACGLPREKAIEYAAATMLGAAQMLLQTGQHPGTLKDAVCSPGGSTIAGLRALEAHGFRGAVMDCVSAAYKRSKELGK